MLSVSMEVFVQAVMCNAMKTLLLWFQQKKASRYKLSGQLFHSGSYSRTKVCKESDYHGTQHGERNGGYRSEQILIDGGSNRC